MAAVEAEREGWSGRKQRLRARLRQAESSHGQAVVAHNQQEDHWTDSDASWWTIWA